MSSSRGEDTIPNASTSMRGHGLYNKPTAIELDLSVDSDSPDEINERGDACEEDESSEEDESTTVEDEVELSEDESLA